MRIIMAQIFGLISLILVLFSYQNKHKEKFLRWQIFANLMDLAEYLFLFAYSAVAAVIIATSRNFIYYKFERKGKRIPIWILLIFEVIIVAFGFITYDGILSTIPVIITMLFSYATWNKNLAVTYVICVISMILYTIYNLYVGAYVAIISNVLELCSGAIGLIRLKKMKE